MQEPNEYGVYEAEETEELARRGRSYVAAATCLCEDGLHRFEVSLFYSYGGFSGPITIHDEGFATRAAAKEAAVQDLLRRWPKPFPGDPTSVRDELDELRGQIEARFRQPFMFE